MYLIEKNITRLKNNQHTFFLDSREMSLLLAKINKKNVHIYYPYKDSERNIVYKTKEPKIILYEIKTNGSIRHQDILGSLYSLNISPSFFGDILIINNHYYIYVLDMIRNYFEANFIMIKNQYIELQELDINTLKNHERTYQKIELVVSSNRIDTIVYSICRIGRNNINQMIKRKEIILNYEILNNISYKLKENDIFSIKTIGKFKYNGVLRTTKSNHLIVEILKYL